MKTKIVTGCWLDCFGPPYQGASIYRKYRYLGGLVYQCLGFAPLQVVCYTHKKNYEEISQLKNSYKLENLEIKLLELEEIKLHDKITKVRERNYIEELSGRGPEIMWGKFDILEREIEGVDKLYWTDVGITHAGIFPWRFNSKFNEVHHHIPLPFPAIIELTDLEQYNFTSLYNKALIDKINDLTNNKIFVLTSLNPQHCMDEFIAKQIVKSINLDKHPIGGFIGGDVNVLKIFINKFWNFCNIVLHNNFYNNDETIMKLCYDEFDKNNIVSTNFDVHYDHTSDILFNHFQQWTKESNKPKPLYTVWQDILNSSLFP
jgi:hypothetical protein